VATEHHKLVPELGAERPVVMGHSMAAAIAGLYASVHPARGIILVDQAMEVLPFAQMLRQVAPMLRGPAFSQAWAGIENGLGLDRIPEPAGTLVLDPHKVNRDVVLRYWDQVPDHRPGQAAGLDRCRGGPDPGPCLAVFGRRATDGECERLARLPGAQIEEWVGDGHFVLHVAPQRFAARLQAFIEHCDQSRLTKARPAPPNQAPLRARRRPCWPRRHATSASPSPTAANARAATSIEPPGLAGGPVVGPPTVLRPDG
jgi:pimeloyl-ACP methyl ester carboxylesterase